MITLHHLNNSRSQRILWLLEELNLPYEITRYERDPKTMLAPDSLRAVHPLGKSPVITMDDQVLAESGAIIQLLLEAHGRGGLLPEPGTPAYRQYTYWLHYAEGSLMPPLLVKLLCSTITGPQVPFFFRPFAKAIASAVNQKFTAPRIQENLSFINDHLGQNAWFAGEALTGADIQMSFPLEAAASRADLSPYPHIEAFLKRAHSREAYQRALKKGGPYDYA